MSDLIKRSDVLEAVKFYIETAETQMENDGYYEAQFEGFEELQDDLFNLETIDAVYICDRKRCTPCWSLCNFTRDIKHAATTEKMLIIDNVRTVTEKERENRYEIDFETARGYMKDLEKDSMWLTDYAQDKKDCQRLIDMTVTMNRAKWLIGELIGYYEPQPERSSDA